MQTDTILGQKTGSNPLKIGVWQEGFLCLITFRLRNFKRAIAFF